MRKILAVTAAAIMVATAALAINSGTAQASGSLNGACNSGYEDSSWTSVTVAAGATCVLDDSTVAANVTVNPNGSFYACDTTIAGSLTDNSGYVNVDWYSSVGGSVSIVPGSGGVTGYGYDCVELIGPSAIKAESKTGRAVSHTIRPAVIKPADDAYSSIFCGRVTGSLSVRSTPSTDDDVSIGEDCNYPDDAYIEGAYVGGSVQIANNKAEVDVSESDVVGVIQCVNDNPNGEVSDTWAVRIIGCSTYTED